MSEAMTEAISETISKTARATSLDTIPAMESATVLIAGTFSDADDIHNGSGSATIYALPNGNKLLRLEEFRVTNGPDLVVYLARHADQKSAEDVKAGFAKLASLKGRASGNGASGSKLGLSFAYARSTFRMT